MTLETCKLCRPKENRLHMYNYLSLVNNIPRISGKTLVFKLKVYDHTIKFHIKFFDQKRSLDFENSPVSGLK